jgi:uncharacterized protein (DUF1015 family)
MAEILPFVATRYNARFNPDLAQLLTPPYDVIDKPMQQALYNQNPYNLVRIDLSKDLPGDSEFDNRYTRAGAIWQQWKNETVIVEDPRKALYVYEQEFTLPGGQTLRRRGFFAAVKLQDFSEGGIRAHEHTFAGPKADRFRLMRATNCNMSPIFCLFDDRDKTVDQMLSEGIEGQPPVETFFQGVTQRLWVLGQNALIRGIAKAMAPQTLFIADGHHRYETSLLYRDEMRAAMGRRNGRQSFDYAMIYLNNIYDDGLVILPTHRVLSKETTMGVDLKEVLEDLGEYFELEPLEIDTAGIEGEAGRFTARMAEAGRRGPSFTMILPKGKAWLLTMKPGANLDEMMDDEEGEQTPRDIKELDVSILHRFIINRAWLGNPEMELDDQDVAYVKDAGEALRMMTSCSKFGVAFLVNPTRIEQVCGIAGQGLRMPHKSTYFYPKLVTGLVMRDLNSPW